MSEPREVVTEPERLGLLRLVQVSQIGPVTISRLLERFGSPEAVFAANSTALNEVEGVGPKTVDAILHGPTLDDARKELDRVAALGARVLTLRDPDYPAHLKTIHDPPPVLYARGELLERDGLAIAIVGTRRASFYGLKQARALATTLASMGFTIVSGMARGIDAAAHEGALAAGGRTLAVFGTGLATIYPQEHVGLADRIAASGALLSEFPVDYPVLTENFPRRNRIVSGISMGVIVIEGGLTSGAMITARCAMEQGRTVFAVPGPIDNPRSLGPHALIQDGACLVQNVSDVLDELGPLPFAVSTPDAGIIQTGQVLQLNEREKKLYSLLDSSPVEIDDLIARSGLSPSEVSSTLTVLELKKLVGQLSGKRFVRLR